LGDGRLRLKSSGQPADEEPAQDRRDGVQALADRDEDRLKPVRQMGDRRLGGPVEAELQGRIAHHGAVRRAERVRRRRRACEHCAPCALGGQRLSSPHCLDAERHK
jgi:hypothetical protein